MNNKEPQYETMPEHCLLCFNGDCVLAVLYTVLY